MCLIKNLGCCVHSRILSVFWTILKTRDHLHIINRKEDGSLRFAILVLVVNFLKLSAMELVLSKMSKNSDI
jgi:hypothetical protein